MADSQQPEAIQTSMALPIRDATTGQPMTPRDQPGYYPGFSTLKQQGYWDSTTRAVVLKRMEQSSPLRFFTEQEARTMLAVTARVLPQQDRTETHRIPILPGIDERLAANRISGYRYADMPSDQKAYQLAAQAFEEMALAVHGASFHLLGIREQEELIKSVHDAKPLAAQGIWSQMSVERFWSTLVSDCCTVYYAHPWAWDEIGFGGPAYPRGYMRLEEGEAEPWEIAECRYEWIEPADTLSGKEESHGSGQEHQSTPGSGGTH
jgi:hypothetical protein